eukprot:1166242-Prorocentrum_lima.AAC.1
MRLPTCGGLQPITPLGTRERQGHAQLSPFCCLEPPRGDRQQGHDADAFGERGEDCGGGDEGPGLQ